MVNKEKTCEVCNGMGAILSFNTKTQRDELQRCDECKKYDSDSDAWENLKPKEAEKERGFALIITE